MRWWLVGGDYTSGRLPTNLHGQTDELVGEDLTHELVVFVQLAARPPHAGEPSEPFLCEQRAALVDHLKKTKREREGRREE